MAQLLKLFVDLCLFRRAAQDVPHSPALVLLTGLLSAAPYVINLPAEVGVVEGIVTGVAIVVFFGAMVWVVLRAARVAERWHQVIAALYGTSALLDFLYLLVAAWFHRGAETPLYSAPPQLVVFAAWLWYVAVMSSILRQAMGSSVAVAVLASLGCWFALSLFGLMLPGIGRS